MTLSSHLKLCLVVALCLHYGVHCTEPKKSEKGKGKEKDIGMSMVEELLKALKITQPENELKMLSSNDKKNSTKSSGSNVFEDMLTKLKSKIKDHMGNWGQQKAPTGGASSQSTYTKSSQYSKSSQSKSGKEEKATRGLAEATPSSEEATTVEATTAEPPTTSTSSPTPATIGTTEATSTTTEITEVPDTKTARASDDFDMVWSIMGLVRKWRKGGLLSPLVSNSKIVVNTDVDSKTVNKNKNKNKNEESAKPASSPEGGLLSPLVSNSKIVINTDVKSKTVNKNKHKNKESATSAPPTEQTTVEMEGSEVTEMEEIEETQKNTDDKQKGQTDDSSQNKKSIPFLQLGELPGSDNYVQKGQQMPGKENYVQNPLSSSGNKKDDKEKKKKKEGDDKEKRWLLRILIKELGNAGKTREELVWPNGNWGLPRPSNQQCPGEAPAWRMGSRYQNTENDMPSNTWSLAYPALVGGSPAKGGVTQNFCMKSDIKDEGSPILWPSGEYCIYRYKGKCPQGFDSGLIHWDDENTNNSNTRSGALPDGVYDKDTQMQFCCRTDGEWHDDVTLPNSKPFLLLQKNPSDCQQVSGMDASQAWFRWDTEDETRAASSAGSVPYNGLVDGEVKLHYCVYFPSKRR